MATTDQFVGQTNFIAIIGRHPDQFLGQTNFVVIVGHSPDQCLVILGNHPNQVWSLFAMIQNLFFPHYSDLYLTMIQTLVFATIQLSTILLFATIPIPFLTIFLATVGYHSECGHVRHWPLTYASTDTCFH